MPTTSLSVSDLFAAAGGLSPRCVRWGETVGAGGPGVYVVASNEDPDDPVGADSPAISRRTANELLAARTELTVDGVRPDLDGLIARLESMWIPSAVAVYVGLADTSLRTRLRQYYRTGLGDSGPHAGGWPIKTLANIDDLWVHYAECGDPDTAERVMVVAFMNWARDRVSVGHCDPTTPLPFANLMVPGGRRKQHGIQGARATRGSVEAGARSLDPLTFRVSQSETDQPAPKPNPSPQIVSGRSQRVTAADLTKRQIRIPSETKPIFPDVKCDLTILLGGHKLTARWDPRNGPDRPRSGIVRIRGVELSDLVAPESVLWIRTANGVYEFGSR